jgi:hypothetical protein
VLPWHLQVTGADFPAVISDNRLSALLEAAVAVDIAGLLGLASPDWVTVQLLSSIAATRRATTAALAADVMVQVPEGDRDASAATMALRATADVLDSWLNESRVVYNSVAAARNAEANQAASGGNAVGTANSTDELCDMTCIIIVCICVVVIATAVVVASVVLWVEEKKRRQRTKDALAEAEGYDASDMDVDDFDAVNAASPSRLNPFVHAQSEGGHSDDGSAVQDGAMPDGTAPQDDAAAGDALEVEDLELDESVALAPQPPQLSALRRASKRLSGAFPLQSPGPVSSRRPWGSLSAAAAADAADAAARTASAQPNALSGSARRLSLSGSARRPSGGNPMWPDARQRLSVNSAQFPVATVGGHSAHGDVTMEDVD